MAGDVICEKKKTCKKDVWPNWFTSHQSHYCLLYYNGVPKFVRKWFDVNSTIAQTTQNINFETSLSASWIYKKWQTLAIIQGVSDSNLETRRHGSKSGVSRITQESWQPCLNLLDGVIYPVNSTIQCLNNCALINMEFGKEIEFELAFTPEPSVALSV